MSQWSKMCIYKFSTKQKNLHFTHSKIYNIGHIGTKCKLSEMYY